MTQLHRNAVFATIAFSDAFERWQAGKADAAEALIMRFYNDELTDEIRHDIAGIVELIDSHPTVEQFNEREARGKRREQRSSTLKMIEESADIDIVAINRLLEKKHGIAPLP